MITTEFKNGDTKILFTQIPEESTIGCNSEYLCHMFKNILCIGDSLTEGDYGSYPEGTANVHSENYPYFLSKMLNTNVINKGSCGTCPLSWWEYNYLNNKIDLSIPYDCIYLFLGTNLGFTDTLEADTNVSDYNDYANTNTGRYCSIIEWLEEHIPNAKIFLINFPRNYREESWYIENNVILNKIAAKYNLPVVDMYNRSPFTRYNGNIYRPVGYVGENGVDLPQKYGNLHFGKLGYLTFAEYLIKNTSEIINNNLTDYVI